MDVIAALRERLGATRILVGDDVPDRNQADAAEKPPVTPVAVVYPATTEEVAAMLQLCHAFGQPVVVQGGMTGLAGGAHPQPGEIALSLERFSGIEEVDRVGRTLTAKAGTTLAEVQEAAAEAGLFYGVDLGSRGSCTIGGNLATNAGGIQVLRYGMTRRNVLGLEAVLADGTVVGALGKMAKNNTGYDWPQLMIGGEGTLGVVTRVVLALQPKPAALQSAVCAVGGVDAALALLAALEQRFPGRIVAFEGMWREYVALVRRLGTLRVPFAADAEITLLVEAAIGADEPAATAFEEVLAEALGEGLIEDAVVARSLRDRESFWAVREASFEFGRLMPKGAHFDISLPLARLSEAVAELRIRAAARLAGATVVAFGHLGDGNLHLALYPRDPEALPLAAPLVYDLVAEFRGSISAEHGIGVLKRPYLGRSRSAAELALMRRIKAALDPRGILNPGRILGPG